MKSLISIAYKILTAFMIVMLALTALPVQLAFAAISNPNPWSSVYAGVAFPGTYVYPVSAGFNRMLVVAVSSTRSTVGAQTATVTYGGQTLTQQVTDGALATAEQHTWLFYLQEAGIAAAAGTNLVVTVTGGTAVANHVYAAVYAGVDQSATPMTSSQNYNSVVAADTNVGPFAANLNIAAGDQAVEIVNLTRSTAGGARTINTWAANWAAALGPNSTGIVSAYIATRTTVGATTSQHISSGADWDSMSAMSIKAFVYTPTTTTVASNNNPALTGQPITFTATVTPGATGTVTFQDGGTTIGSGVLAGGVPNQATFSTSALAVGSHNITAVYGGDAINDTSTSAILVQVVNQAPAITSLNAITFTLGQNNTFTATANGSPVPTWAIGGVALPNAVTFNAGTHILSGIPAAGTVGTYAITFTATNTAGTDTQNVTLNVVKGPQTITFANPPTPAGFGTTFTINPVSNNGAGQPTLLPVTVVASGACTIAGNVVTYNALGTCTLTASQAGNASYNAAANVVRTVAVQPAATTITISPSVNPSVLGQNVDFTVRVFAGGVPVTGGTVTITSCEWVVFFCAGGTTQTWGTYTLVGGVVVVPKANLPVDRIGGNIVPSRITVTYNPTGNYNGSNTTLDQTVSTASTNVALTSSINPSFFGQSVTFTATVTVSPPGAGSVSGGTVTFYDGVTLLCTVTNIPGNTAICTTSALVRGTHNITAHYEGTDQFGTSTSPILAQIVRRDSDIALISSLNPSVYGNTVTFTATVTDPAAAGTPTGTVSFYDDVTLLGTSNLNAGAVATFNTSLLSTGSHNITATYNGDTFYVAGTSLVVVQVVNPATLTVTADPKTTTYGDNNVAFTYTFSGFVNGETLATSDVTGTADCATTDLITSPVGPYPITCTIGSLTSNNYTFTFVAGTLTVTPKALTITADNQGKTYGFSLALTGTEFSSIGLINADTVTSVTLTCPQAADPAAVNGTYPIVPSAPIGSGLGNYAITYVNGTLTIGGNLLIITANDRVKTYGQAVTFAGTEFTYFIPNGTPGGGTLLPGETITGVTLTSFGTPANAPVGTYSIVPSNVQGTNLVNYVKIYTNGVLDVNPAPLTFTPDSYTKIYGDTFNGYSGAFTGLFGFDNTITPAYDSPGAPATATVTAPGPSYPINVSFTDPNSRLGNYTLTLNTATLTVTPRTLTVTPTNRNKTYGDTLTVADFSGTIAGIQNGDNITATYDSPLGDPATAVVGNYDINAAISAPGGLGNYALVNNVGTLTVTKRDLVVTSDSQSKIYGDAFSAFTGSVVGLQNGDVVTPTYDSLGAPAAAAAGVYNITVLPLVGDTSNYNLIYNIGTLAVTRRDLVFTPTNRTKIYGDTITFTAADGTVTGLQAGDAITPVYSSPGAISTATVAGSPYPIIVTLNDPGGKLSNYNYTLNSGVLTVTLRDLTVITDNQNKQYGTWFFAFTGSFIGIQNGENITANYASAGSLPSAAVGGYPITATLIDPNGKLGNYNVINNFGTLTVSSSNLTVTADNKTITYGDPDPAFTFTYTGFASGDTSAVIDTPPTCTVAVPHTDFGTYPIVCSGGVDNAYTFTYVAGTLTVNKRALVVTPTDKTKVYGDLFTAFTGTITGVQGTDVFTATYASTGAPVTATVAGSPYPITATLNDPGGRAGNYTVTLNTGLLSVTQRALTVTPADKTKIYGDVFTLFTGTITGIQNGDAITATYASTGAVATATVAGSPYPITATLNALPAVLANYSITNNQGNLAVTLRTLTVTPDNQSKAFGVAFSAFTGVVVGIQNGDVITPVYDSLGAPAVAASGLYPITVTLNALPAVLANYTVTLNSGTLTVGSNILTVTANNQTIVYGDPDPTFSFTYSGFQGGDTAAVLTTQPTCQVLPVHNAVGTFPITCAGGVDGNYTFSYVPATLTVTRRALTVTPDNQTKVYGDLFTAYTGVAIGIQGADNITVTYASAGGAATAAVGTYNITATLNDPNNRLAANYTVTLNTNTLVVTPRPLVATPDDKNKVYGALFTAFTGTITGIQNGDVITPVYASTGAPAVAAIGLYDITVTLNATPAVLANYTVTLNIGTLSVGGNFLIVTPADKTKIYGDVFGAFTGTIVGLQPGDIITATYASTGAGANAAVGNYDITATLVDPGGKLGNYTVIMNTGTLSVTPRTLTVTPDNKAKAFGTAFNAFTGSVVGIQNGDAITETYASTGAGAAAAVGAYPITVTLNATPAVLANYTVTLNTGVLTVGTNILTVTAIDQSIIYGAPDPTFTFTYAGFQGGDTAAVLTTLPTCQVLPVHNDVGTYPISCAGGVDESYIFSYVSATLTVTRRALTVTPANQTKVYGDVFTAYTGVTTGIQGADNISATYTSVGGIATAAVGTYPITATLNDPNNRLANNYTVTLNTGTLTVTPRPLAATPDDKNKAYGVLFTAFTGNIVGIQNGDAITPVYASTGAPVVAAVGLYDITVTLNATPAVLANYTVTLNIGTLSVGGNFLIVTPADKTKVYGDVFAAFTGTIVGLQPGDIITATYASTGAPANAGIGNYDIAATLVDPGGKLGNYTVIMNTGTLSVTPRPLIVTPDNKAKAFGTVFSAFTGTVVGLQNGDAITPVYASTGAPAAVVAGSYPITVTLNALPAVLANYAVTLNTGILTVGTNVLTVTANNQTIVYGNPDPVFTFTYAGFQGGDTAAVIDTPPTCQVSVAHNAVGTFPIACSGGIDNNYVFSYTPGTLTVTRRALTVTPDNKTKVYGDLFTAYTGVTTGIQGADNITATYASTGAVVTAGVGAYNITATLNDPNNRLAANYTVTLNTGTLAVTPRPLAVTPDDKNKVYGTLFTAFTGNIVGIQNGDAIAAIYASLGAPAAAAGGTYSITATLNALPAVLANYAVTLNTGTLTVGGNTLVVIPADKTKIYGDVFSAFTGTVVGLQPGDNITVTYASAGAAANTAVGDYPITATLNDPGNKLPNYTLVMTTGTLSVTPRNLIVVPDNENKLLGTLFTAFTGTVTGIQAGDNITANYDSTGAPAAAVVGTYPITATLNDPGNRLANYAVTKSNATLTVGSSFLTVTADNQTMVYGDPDPAFTFTYSGFLGGDTAAVIDTPPTCQVSAAHNAVGSYSISCSGGLDNSYIFSYAPNATLTVTKRALTVTPADQTKGYGTVFTAFTGGIIGIQAGDNITATYDSTGAPAAALVGTYPITATLVDPGNRLSNYTVTLNTGTLTVGGNTLVVTPDDKVKTYGSVFNAFTGTLAGLQPGDNITATYSSTGSPATVAAGTYPITVTLNDPDNKLPNYTVVLNDGKLTVNPHTLTVTPDNQTKVFGTIFTAFTGNIAGIQNGDNITAAYDSNGAPAAAAVGTYDIKATLNDPDGKLPNYAVTLNTGKLTVFLDSTRPTVTVNQDAAQADPTNVTPINFTVVFSEPVTGFTDTGVTIGGTTGATLATVSGSGPTYNVAVIDMKHDGIVTVTIPAGAAKDVAGNDSAASTSTDNSVAYFDGIGPNVQVINTAPETSDHALLDAEVLTFNITQLTVKFNQDVYNPAGDSEKDDVTNPNNYMLVRDLGDTAGVQTVTCASGVSVPADTKININAVTYDSATYTATFAINDGQPLTNGDYHLFVCGTTSIVDPMDHSLALIGSSGLPNTDFRRSFTVNIQDNGGPGDNNNNHNTNTTNTSFSSGNSLIPVTGFSPDAVTLLPIQPADKAYKSMDNIRIEIPTLGINFPIVGVLFKNDDWDLTWLQNSVGYLEGSAYPTHSGNTVLTAHVIDARNNLGPFSDIKGLNLGDSIYIHAYGQIYVYQVQENKMILPTKISTVFKHEEYNWVTLVTCEYYSNKTGAYLYRRMVRAILVSIIPEK